MLRLLLIIGVVILLLFFINLLKSTLKNLKRMGSKADSPIDNFDKENIQDADFEEIE